MTLIRGTSLAGFPELVAELGGDAGALLKTVGMSANAVGDRTAFIDYVGVLRVLEGAARATGALDFGRRLAERQGVEIFGPVGIAASSAATFGEAVETYVRYLRAYSPAIQVGLVDLPDPRVVFWEFRVVLCRLPRHPQGIELSLGVALRVFRFLLGPDYRPVSVHLPHEALAPRREYVRYFGAAVEFGAPAAGFTIRLSDLTRPLSGDRVMREALVAHLEATTPSPDAGLSAPVAELIRRLLPTGTGNLAVVADRLSLHPRTLQRRLAEEGTSYEALVDDVRRRTAEAYLRDTDMALGHLASELGYAEQSGLARAARRWFGVSPRAHRRALRASG
jgi:AraC-like DNA-binding protein